MSKEDDMDTFGYMCTTDFDYELGYADGGNTIYPSVENLKKYKRCWESCGIVKVKVEYVDTITLPLDTDE
jgi:hypothetical protein